MIKAYFRLSTGGKRGRKRISKSFVAAFINMMYSTLTGTVYAVTDTSGSTVTPYSVIQGNFYCAAPYGDHVIGVIASTSASGSNRTGLSFEGDLFGIIPGSGTAAITTIDDNVQTPITHGTGSGQLQYLGMLMPSDVTVAGTTASINIERLFLNGSGGDVIVNEVALYAGVYLRTASGTYTPKYYCLIHDLVSPAVTVANGEYLKIMYTIQVTA